MDWGVKNVRGDKNVNSLKKAGGLIAQYQLRVLVLQDREDSRCHPRIQELSQKLITLAATHQVVSVTHSTTGKSSHSYHTYDIIQ